MWKQHRLKDIKIGMGGERWVRLQHLNAGPKSNEGPFLVLEKIRPFDWGNGVPLPAAPPHENNSNPVLVVRRDGR